MLHVRVGSWCDVQLWFASDVQQIWLFSVGYSWKHTKTILLKVLAEAPVCVETQTQILNERNQNLFATAMTHGRKAWSHCSRQRLEAQTKVLVNKALQKVRLFFLSLQLSIWLRQNLRWLHKPGPGDRYILWQTQKPGEDTKVGQSTNISSKAACDSPKESAVLQAFTFNALLAFGKLNSFCFLWRCCFQLAKLCTLNSSRKAAEWNQARSLMWHTGKLIRRTKLCAKDSRQNLRSATNSSI